MGNFFALMEELSDCLLLIIVSFFYWLSFIS